MADALGPIAIRETEAVMSLITDIEEEEDGYLYTAQYTWAKCINSLDAVKWIEAYSKERILLEAGRTLCEAKSAGYA